MQIESLCQPLAPVARDIACAAAQNMFLQNPDLLSIAIVDGERPIGLINRQDLLVHLSQQFGFSLYGRKPVTALMDANPLIVEGACALPDVVSRIAMEKPSAVLQGFIVTRAGSYRGICTGLEVLQATNAQMAERARELEETRRGLELANGAKSRFLAQMSHELRTPLNAIIGFSELMREGVFGPLGNTRYHGYCEDIHASGSHLLQLINEVLDMAKIEAGRMTLNEAPVRLDHLLGRCLRLVAGMAEQAGVAIVLELPDDLPALMADEVKLQQIVINLLSNALRFTLPGGRVTVRVAADGSGLAVAIADTGIGIPADKLELVMQPFGQADNSLQRRHDGTGLGLPLARVLVELHGGRLELDSIEGQGTTVTVRLPSKLFVGLADARPPDVGARHAAAAAASA